MDESPSAPVQLSRTRDGNEPSSDVVAIMLEPDLSNDQHAPIRRRSVRSPGLEVSKPAADEGSLQNEMKDDMVERPSTPTRRSVRSPGREVSVPPAESAQGEMKDVVVELPVTPTRRRSVRSPGREVTEQSVNEDNAVELLSTPTRRQSVRSPSREVIEPVVEASVQNEDKAVIVDNSSMSTRRRSLRSPGREVLEPLVEEAVQSESREKMVVVEEEDTSARRRSLRSPSRQKVIEPSGEDSVPMETTGASVEQPGMTTRRRSFHSPGLEVTEHTVQDSADTKSVHVTPARRRSVGSREVIEPLVEESLQSENKEVMVDLPGTSTRRRSLRSPSRDITQPAHVESEEVAKSSTRTRRRSLRSPSREVIEPPVEEVSGATVDQPVVSTRRRSICSPSREAAETSVAEKLLPVDVKTVHSGRARSNVSPSREIPLASVLDDSSPAKNTDQHVEEQQPATPTRRRFVRSVSRERVVFTDKIDESMTPVRRSLRQKEKLDRAEEKDLGGMSVIQKTPQTSKGRKTSSDQALHEAEVGDYLLQM